MPAAGELGGTEGIKRGMIGAREEGEQRFQARLWCRGRGVYRQRAHGGDPALGVGHGVRQRGQRSGQGSRAGILQQRDFMMEEENTKDDCATSESGGTGSESAAAAEEPAAAEDWGAHMVERCVRVSGESEKS